MSDTEISSMSELYKLIVASNEKQTENIKKELHSNIERITANIDSSEQKIKAIQKKQLDFERRQRRNNIIVFGIETTDGNLVQQVLDILNNLLGTSLVEQDIDNLYRVGRNTNSPVLIEFISYLKKTIVFKNTRKLKGSKVSIAHDLCPEDREEHRILRKHLKIAKEKKLQAKIKGHQLEIDGELYTAEELERKSEESEEESSEGECQESGVKKNEKKQRQKGNNN